MRIRRLVAVMFLVRALSVGPAAVRAADPKPLSVTVPESEGPNWLGLGLAGAGILAGVGLTAVLKTRADDHYDDYLLTADPETGKELLDRAQRLDRWSLVGIAVAQVSFVALVLLLIQDRDRPVIPTQGQPLVESSADGVRLGWTVAP